MEKNEKEDEFVCRTYGKSELAQLYCPDIEPKTAVAKLNQWIEGSPGEYGVATLCKAIYACASEAHCGCAGRTLKQVHNSAAFALCNKNSSPCNNFVIPCVTRISLQKKTEISVFFSILGFIWVQGSL